ncbi:MAG TPA: sialidase family protein, partial [Vicinamibacterales bacterium]|nr:sialidase family protein [Vicinamibacterales bacterium]
WDRGATWLFRDNLPVSQFYEISADMQEPYTICGGLQDNGHWCVPSATRVRTGISNRDAFNIGSGDGFYARIDPSDPRTVVVESQEGRANRVDLATLERQAIQPSLPKGSSLRWNWNTPLVMSTADPKVLYIGANILFRSADRGVTWKAMSPDLTTNADRSALQMMGGAVGDGALSRHDGQTFYSTLTTIAESPLDARVLYTGSDDGQVQVTKDGGQTWTNITSRIAGAPARTYVSSVLASRHAAGRVYATFDGHYTDDDQAYVAVSDDFGQTWRPIASDLPQTSVHKLREHPRNARLLFVGHERGIHFSIDAGGHWSSLTLNMPHAPVDDLLIHPRDNDLVVGTHGRGIWVLDNIGAIEALTPESMTDSFLAPPARAQLLTIYSPQAWYGAGQFFAPNPDFGAAIDYYLRDAAGGTANTVKVIVSDAAGATVRRIAGPAARGVNRVRWDLRMEPPLASVDAASQPTATASDPVAPTVLAGTYVVTVQLPSGRTLKAPLVVADDPRIRRSDGDRRSRQTALLKLYELEKAIGRARSAVRSAAGSSGRTPNAPAPAKLDQLLGSLTGELNQASALSRSIDGYSGPPTTDQRRSIDTLSDDVARTVAELGRALRTDSLNQKDR